MREAEEEQSDLGATVREGEARDIVIADCIFLGFEVQKTHTHAVEDELMETVWQRKRAAGGDDIEESRRGGKASRSPLDWRWRS